MTKLSALATAAILAGSASAHTIFQKLYVNGVDQGELVGIRAPDYDGVRVPFPLVISAKHNAFSRAAHHRRHVERHHLQRGYQPIPPARLPGRDQRACRGDRYR